jgi:integrase
MRQGEIAQLRTDDVRLLQGVLCIFIAADGDDVDEADRKRVKTEAGERYVPVHPMLEQIGFARHVEKMRKAGAERLFPDIVRGADGYFSPFSKWFSRFLAEAGVKRDRNAFHSFPAHLPGRHARGQRTAGRSDGAGRVGPWWT